MTPPHFKDFEFPRDHSLQRASVISTNRDPRRNETEVDQIHVAWQNEPSLIFKDGFQQQPSRRGLHRARNFHSDPSTLQRTSPMEDVIQGFNLEFYWKEPESIGKSSLREIFFKGIMKITKI
ncbi:hypothetical protein O181_034230 [Austropuccinia psidii MF-1]|uniref:Uncharacterized protein n=1 Tax=Austropuccinia psidii MF-1 TaxID=1389203 RepID=A0A9Q3H9Z7_9BASI|nr:hypothetical protein [Austropuccinia psidii MF-1]